LREEVGGKVFRIVVQPQGSGGLGQAEMVRTKAEMRLRASEAATLAIGVTVETTRGIVAGNAGRFRKNGDDGILCGWIHDAFLVFLSSVLSLGGTPGNLYEYQTKRLTKFAFRKCLIRKEMFLAEPMGCDGKNRTEKRKAGASSRTPNTVIYEIKYSTNYGNVKGIFRFF